MALAGWCSEYQSYWSLLLPKKPPGTHFRLGWSGSLDQNIKTLHWGNLNTWSMGQQTSVVSLHYCSFQNNYGDHKPVKKQVVSRLVKLQSIEYKGWITWGGDKKELILQQISNSGIKCMWMCLWDGIEVKSRGHVKMQGASFSMGQQ